MAGTETGLAKVSRQVVARPLASGLTAVAETGAPTTPPGPVTREMRPTSSVAIGLAKVTSSVEDRAARSAAVLPTVAVLVRLVRVGSPSATVRVPEAVTVPLADVALSDT